MLYKAGSRRQDESKVLCNYFVTHLLHINKGLPIKQPILIINEFWFRRPDLNRHGRVPFKDEKF